MRHNISIETATIKFFEDFYILKSEESNIYWSGYENIPIKNNLKMWYETELLNKNRQIFKVTLNSNSVGYLYLDFKDEKKIELSYAISQKISGKGYGTQVVAEAIKYIKSYFNNASIVAYVATINKASLSVLEKNNFKVTGNSYKTKFKQIEEDIEMIEYTYMEDRCFIIAEAGVNHNGDIRLAKKLIDVAVEAGADAVKFQTWKTELLVTTEAKQAEYQTENTGIEESQFDMLKKLELSYDEFRELKKYCDNKNIIFLSTPDESTSADFLMELQNIFKIGSGELTNIPFLKYIGALGTEIILSTGMGTIEEIDTALHTLISTGIPKKDITVLHATTMYPTPMNEVNLKAMQTISNKFDIKVGYSDHTMGIEVPIAAVALGARIIEKHFTLSREMEGPDHKASLEPLELKEMVNAIRNIEMALGNGEKRPQKSEEKNKKIVRKSIVARKKISKGEVFSSENIETKRVGYGISSIMWDSVIGKVSKYNFELDEMIRLEDG